MLARRVGNTSARRSRKSVAPPARATARCAASTSLSRVGPSRRNSRRNAFAMRFGIWSQIRSTSSSREPASASASTFGSTDCKQPRERSAVEMNQIDRNRCGAGRRRELRGGGTVGDVRCDIAGDRTVLRSHVASRCARRDIRRLRASPRRASLVATVESVRPASRCASSAWRECASRVFASAAARIDVTVSRRRRDGAAIVAALAHPRGQLALQDVTLSGSVSPKSDSRSIVSACNFSGSAASTAAARAGASATARRRSSAHARAPGTTPALLVGASSRNSNRFPLTRLIRSARSPTCVADRRVDDSASSTPRFDRLRWPAASRGETRPDVGLLVGIDRPQRANRLAQRRRFLRRQLREQRRRRVGIQAAQQHRRLPQV